MQQNNNEVGLPKNTGGDNTANGAPAEKSKFGPIMSDGVYNEEAHAYLEEKRVEQDLTIPAIVQGLGKQNCKFVDFRWVLGNTKLQLIFHPNPEGELTEGLEWTEVNAAQVKNGGKLYTKVSNGRVEWLVKRLRGNIMPMLAVYFGDDLKERTYRDPKKIVDFTRRAANFSQLYPHEELTTFGCYITTYMNLIRAMDTKITNIEIKNLLVSIAGEMRRYANVFDNEKKLTPLEIYKEVREAKTKRTIQQCSKEVQYKLSQIDINAQAAINSLELLDQLVAEEEESERLETQARLNAFSAFASGFGSSQPKAIENGANTAASLKRPRESLQITMLEDDDQNPENCGPELKKRRIEEQKDESTVDSATSAPSNNGEQNK